MVDEDERITIEEIAETLGIWHRRPVKHEEERCLYGPLCQSF